MKNQILIILFLVFISCKNVTEKESENVRVVVDSSKLKTETAQKPTENSILTSFLKNPIDLQKFKKSKNINYTTTSVCNGMDYHFHPKIKDSIFYTYNYPTKNFKDSKRIDQVVVFKHGKNKHTYDDETEVLIELRIFNIDSDLGKANLVGFTKTELELEFGNDYLTLDNRIVYSHKNKVLILELENSKVKSYRYIKLSSEKIDTDLIGQILK